LRASNNRLQSTIKTEPKYDSPVSLAQRRHGKGVASHGLSSSSLSRKRPVSIRDAAERVALHRENHHPMVSDMRSLHARRHFSFSNPNSVDDDTPSRRPKLPRTQTPTTPSSFKREDAGDPSIISRLNRQLPNQRQLSNDLRSYGLQQQETPLTGSPQLGPTKNVSFADDEDIVMDNGGFVSNDSSDDWDPIVSAPHTTDRNASNTVDRPTSMTLPSLDTAVAQDASLPSPSLSPVTAALHHGHPADYFTHDDDDDEDEDDTMEDRFGLPPSQDQDAESQNTIRDYKSMIPSPTELPYGKPENGSPSLMDIPTMINSFDALPNEMKTTLMWHFLKRCHIKTLQFVAGEVNPALKCDFLTMLPIELSLNVVKYLDAKSMCRAAQVSRKWRLVINSDEGAWEKLFHQDGFFLPEGELKRAIREGWGWQNPDGMNDWERDISEFGESAVGSVARAGQPLSPPPAGRPKRKAAARYSSSTRIKSRKRESRSATYESEAVRSLMDGLSNNEKPYAAASAAAQAVPNPSVGLPSLKNLHLFKSIYQRHYLIRKMWFQEEVKPRHISFRAHQRHVVTCLQFDGDKILTGSDDTNINVYDTKTGALRKKLEGHEGGVWALQYVGNTLVSGSTDRSVRVWDIEEGRVIQVFDGHTSTVRCLQILEPTEIGKDDKGNPILMPKEPIVITGSRDSTLRIWKLPQKGEAVPERDSSISVDESPYFVRALTGHQHSVRALAAHGDTLVSGSYDCSVRVWKISTGETKHRLMRHSQKVYSVVLDHKRNRCISGSMDNHVMVWDLETGTVLYDLEGHSSLVGLLDLSHDRLVSAAADSTLRVWDPETGKCRHKLEAHTGAITCFQHDADKVISGSDKNLKMWNVQTGECVKDLLTDLSGVWQVRFNERVCVAAIQRNNMTYIEVLDFGAARDGVPESQRGRRIVVNTQGVEIVDAIDDDVEGA
jgi:F-box and WD-40 domain protein CDC4